MEHSPGPDERAPARPSRPPRRNPLNRRAQISVAIAFIATVLSAGFQHAGVSPVLTFFTTAIALAFLATLVGEGTEQIGARLGPGATGVLQSGLGNLPELFIGIFLLREAAGKTPAVQAALIGTLQAALVGSILGNSLLVLGLAFLIGGLRHGTQRFSAEPIRNIASLSMLAAAALAVPTLAHNLQTSAALHEEALSVICAIVLLVVFAANIPFSLQGGPSAVVPAGSTAEAQAREEAAWPVWLALAILLSASVAAAFVSSWFVDALTPATNALHLSQSFTGLVIVAIAGNAVENLVGVQLMARNRPDYAISVILNSSLQVALALIPVLVLLSFVVGSVHLTLVLSPLLLGSLLLAAILIGLVVYDGESTWLEGVALIGLYVIIAAGFWWG
ncbi:MAG TPA: sodium:proton exchanger [Chloroflexota bacterium]|jgi:Ca2+:H+ antiporter|nr:sodium:proton exchanger [Chloroflexota bacterium]